MPLLSFIAWKTPAITNKNMQSIMMAIPPSAKSNKIGEAKPLKMLIPPALPKFVNDV